MTCLNDNRAHICIMYVRERSTPTEVRPGPLMPASRPVMRDVGMFEREVIAGRSGTRTPGTKCLLAVRGELIGDIRWRRGARR